MARVAIERVPALIDCRVGRMLLVDVQFFFEHVRPTGQGIASSHRE